MRVDFNVPLAKDKKGKIAVEDNAKIKAVLPTIKDLRSKGARLVLMSHLGRPGGKVKKDLRMEPLAAELKKLLPKAKKDIGYLPSWNFESIKEVVSLMKDGEVLLLENLRFKKEEEQNSAKFARELAGLGRVYINDAFASSHRKHASIVAITKYLPAYAGLLLQKEIEALERVVKKPTKPLVVLMGGFKMSTKIGVIKNLSQKADYILLGGALANVFFKAQKLEIGKSLYEEKEVKNAKRLLKNKKIVLPVDVVVSSSKKGKPAVKKPEEVAKNEMILDIGPETINKYAMIIHRANTIVWNGPLGYYEAKPFSHASVALGRLAASRSSGRAFGVAGGGETLEVVKLTLMGKFFDHLSTAGGAMLMYLEGRSLPGLEALGRK